MNKVLIVTMEIQEVVMVLKALSLDNESHSIQHVLEHTRTEDNWKCRRNKVLCDFGDKIVEAAKETWTEEEIKGVRF